jgi:hypothetical protein
METAKQRLNTPKPKIQQVNLQAIDFSAKAAHLTGSNRLSGN